MLRPTSTLDGRAFYLEDATPDHLEAFFNYRMNDYISITPGVIVLFNPERFSSNETTFVGAIRTTLNLLSKRIV